MKLYATALVCVIFCCGCEKQPTSESNMACETSRVLTDALKTNVSTRAIRLSKGIRGSLKNVKRKEEKKGVVVNWRDALLAVSVENRSAADQYEILKESATLLDWDVIGAMHDSGCTLDEVWDLRFRLVDWLDGHLRRMRNLCVKKGQDDREQRAAWTYYQALAEYREQLVENFERFYLDERDFASKETQLEELRKALSAKIGRPVRRPTEIRALGIYAREVRDRIQKERVNSAGR